MAKDKNVTNLKLYIEVIQYCEVINDKKHVYIFFCQKGLDRTRLHHWLFTTTIW